MPDFPMFEFELDPRLRSRLISAAHPGKLIVDALAYKIRAKLFGRKSQSEPISFHNGLVLFDGPDLHGGGRDVGQFLFRLLHERGIQRCRRLFEFCAGPGYVGYYLLSLGMCETLCLADVNPRALEVARRTAAYNGLDHLVTIHQSDVLDSIPPDERWDLVIGFPPGDQPASPEAASIIYHDPDWQLHRRFYSSIRRFMQPNGHVFLVENMTCSHPRVFEEMIREAGGTPVGSPLMTDIRGRTTDFYCAISQWP
jgi:predicted O-methyltransferase YrrM